MLYIFAILSLIYVSILLRYILKHILNDTHQKNFYDSY